MSDEYDLNELGSMKATTFVRVLYALLARGAVQMQLAEEDKVCLFDLPSRMPGGLKPGAVERVWKALHAINDKARTPEGQNG